MASYLVGSGGKLPMRVKLLYGWGDLFGGGALNLIGFYYLIFLTDVVNINPAWAGLVILASKGWDAVSDPLMGIITDRTGTRLGRRRPYFIVNVFSVPLCMVLLWFPAPFSSELQRFLFALTGYLIFSTASTVLMVPYLSMMPILARDYGDRISLNAIKMAFSFGAGILAAVVPMQIVAAFGEPQKGYPAMALILGLFYALPWIFISLGLREPDSRGETSAERFGFAQFFAPLRLRSFRYLSGIYLGAFLVLDIMSGLIAYYMTHVLGRPGDLRIVLGVLIVCQLLSMPAVSILAKRIGKNRMAILAALVWIGSVAFMALSPADWPAWVIYLQAAITGFGVCGSLVMPWALYPDAADVGELAFSRDCAGSFSGLMTFFRKLASAVALFIIGLVLQYSGYLRPEAAGLPVVQPASALAAIRLLLCLGPVVLLGMVILLAAKNPLTKESYDVVRRRLDFLRGASDRDVAEDELRPVLEKLV